MPFISPRVRSAALAAAAAFAIASAAAQEAPAAASARELPRSFRGLALGMGLDELKAALAADADMAFRGDRDVSLLPLSEQVLVDTAGTGFVRRAYFQLAGGKVFLMAFDLDPARIDHYSVFAALGDRYGEPAELDPARAVWLSGATRLSLERPLTVKYLDRPAFDALAASSRVKESKEAELRKEFLDGL